MGYRSVRTTLEVTFATSSDRDDLCVTSLLCADTLQERVP
jgi:hypothetical protein